MSDNSGSPYGAPQEPYGSPGQQPPPPSYGGPGVPAPYGAPGMPMPPGAGELGKVRSTGICILLTIVTFGIYPIVYYYMTHEEMKRHSGDGLGGVVALLLALFVGIVMPFLSSAEVGKLYARTGRPEPVSGVTGLWYFPGIFILVGPLVWFIKHNGALNGYWRSQGAQG